MMRRFFLALAFVLGIAPAAHAALGIDGNVKTTTGTATSLSATLTTTSTNDVIVVFVSVNGFSTSTLTDTAGLTYTLRKRVTTASNSLEEWWAIAPSALSSDVITASFGGNASFSVVHAFGISGANTASPFDPNASLPGSGTTALVVVSTSNANDIIIGAYDSTTSNPTAGTGFTQLQGGTNFYMAEYQIVSTTQSSLTIPMGTSSPGRGIGDAVVAAGASTMKSLSHFPLLGL